MTKFTRACAITPEFTAEGRTITGVAAVYYDPSNPETVYRYQMMRPGDKTPIDVEERILPGAFSKAIAEDEVMCLYNHEEMLGRRVPNSPRNTLTLSDSREGLRYSNVPPDDHLGNRVVGLLQRGDVTGSSFQFVIRPGGVTYRQPKDSKYLIRELTDLQLIDVSPVDNPAYRAATVGLRCEERSQAEEQLLLAQLAPEIDQRQWDADRADALLLKMQITRYGR